MGGVITLTRRPKYLLRRIISCPRYWKLQKIASHSQTSRGQSYPICRLDGQALLIVFGIVMVARLKDGKAQHAFWIGRRIEDLLQGPICRNY